MKNKRIYARVKNNEKEIHLFEFPLLEVLRGDNVKLKIGKTEVTLFIDDKGLSREVIDKYACWGDIENPNEWLKELLERRKQAE